MVDYLPMSKTTNQDADDDMPEASKEHCDEIIESVMISLFVEQEISPVKLAQIEVAYAVEDSDGDLTVVGCSYEGFVTSEFAKSEPDLKQAAEESKEELTPDHIMVVAVASDNEACVAVIPRPKLDDLIADPGKNPNGPDRSLN